MQYCIQIGLSKVSGEHSLMVISHGFIISTRSLNASAIQLYICTIGGNFQGRKLANFKGLSVNFLWKSTAILTHNWWSQMHETFLSEFLILHQFVNVFSLKNFPLHVLYMYNSLPCSSHMYSTAYSSVCYCRICGLVHEYHTLRQIIYCSKPVAKL